MNISSPHPASADWLTKLNSERDTLRDFVALLEQEQQILLGSDTDPLLQLAERKTRISEVLFVMSKVRRQALPDATNTEVWLQNNAPDKLPVWKEIRQLAEQSRQLNHTNGELIQIKMRYNQQALGVLVGATQNAAGLYGQNGQPNLPKSGRALGSG